MFGYISLSIIGLIALSVRSTRQNVASIFSDLCRVVKRQLDAWDYLYHGRLRIFNEYKKAKGSPFLLHTPDNDLTFVSSEKHIKEISEAANDTLSLHAASKQVLQPHYTMHGFNWHDKRGVEGLGFVRALRTLLTNHLPSMTPELKQITTRLFQAKIGPSTPGRTYQVAAYPLIKHQVSRISGYAFFGKELMEDEQFMDAALGYIEQVLIGAEILRLVPKLMLPVVAKFITTYYRCQYTLYDVLMDVVNYRLQNQPANMSQSEKPTFTYALYDICIHDSYVQPLREEINGLAFKGFQETGQGLPLMDSFLKESSRLTPVEAMTTRRQALKPFFFSDNTKIEKNQWACVALGAMLHDSDLYPEPLQFDGFRFVDPELLGNKHSVQPDGPSKLTDVSYKWQVWGSGKMTCAGRFYVAYVMKLLLSHILLNYDVELADAKAPRSMVWRSLALPNRKTEVVFKCLNEKGNA